MTTEPLSVRHYYAMAIMAGATLFAQVALTRLFSVVQYYHGAFLAISVALFGFAVSGVYVLLRGEAFTRDRLDALVARYSLFFAATIPASFFFYLYLGVGPTFAALGIQLPGVIETGLEYLLLAAPFFASGCCISLLLRHGIAQANRLYATDLIASAAGAVVVVPSLALFGGPRSMLVASLLATSAALVMRTGIGRTRSLAGGLAFVTLAGLVLVPNSAFNVMHLRKPHLVVATEEIRWNSFSMVGVGQEKQENFRRPDGTVRAQRVRNIIIDNSVATVMLHSDGDLEKLSFLELDWNAGAYQLKEDGDVLIIGAGGGRDIMAARVHGQREIWALEVNPLVMETADEIFGDFTSHVYSSPNVHAVVGDARSFVANSTREYDVILASLIDTWAASAAGAFALTENLLYTKDAFLDYFDHLSDDGILSISRWHPMETPRLIETGLEAWSAAGVADPRAHAVVLLSNAINFGQNIVVLLMKKSPFTPEEVATLESFSAAANLQVILSPAKVGNTVVAEYLEARDQGREPWPGIDTAPATDDRPFFFNMVRPSVQLRQMLGSEGPTPPEGFKVNLTATRTLIQLLAAVSILVALTILLPLLWRRDALVGPRMGSVLAYFSCLGLGYILIEVVLIQRLILLLGQPVYSLAVILSTMLLMSGLGSFASRNIREDQMATRMPQILLAASGVLLLYTWGLPHVIRSLLGTPFPLRLACAAALVALPAFLLGMPFPCGLRTLAKRRGESLVPWVWGLNGATSVLASVGSIILAIEFGYSAVFGVGVACYAGAAFFIRRWASV